jgi:hypothetical protein
MSTWSWAFAEQAASDLDAYDLLSRSNLPACHRLHYLQMWLEKLCKAYLWRHEREGDLRMRHNVVAKVLPKMFAQYWRRMGFKQSPNIQDLREICRKIDLLHPQIDDNGNQPDNVEYPWVVMGDAVPPASFHFALASRLFSPCGKALLTGATKLTRTPAIFL